MIHPEPHPVIVVIRATSCCEKASNRVVLTGSEKDCSGRKWLTDINFTVILARENAECGTTSRAVGMRPYAAVGYELADDPSGAEVPDRRAISGQEPSVCFGGLPLPLSSAWPAI